MFVCATACAISTDTHRLQWMQQSLSPTKNVKLNEFEETYSCAYKNENIQFSAADNKMLAGNVQVAGISDTGKWMQMEYTG